MKIRWCWGMTISTCALIGACSSEGSRPEAEDEDSLSAPRRYIVGFRDHARGQAAMRGLKAEVKRDLAEHRLIAAILSDGAVASFKGDDNVEFIEEDAERRMSAQTVPYGISMVQATDAAFSAAAGRNRKVCVIDSGLYTQ